MSGSYKDDLKIGEWREYDEKGKIKEIEIFDSNQDVIKSIRYYYKNGKLSRKTQFKDNSDEEWRYNENEQIEINYTRKFSEGEKNEQWKYYDKAGHLRLVNVYKDGNFKEKNVYHENGQLYKKQDGMVWEK